MPPHVEPIDEENNQADLWSHMRFETIYGNPAWQGGGAWHFSTFGSSAEISSKFGAWGHSNQFLSPAEQAKRRAATAQREGGRAELAVQPRKYSGFRSNGYENDALSEERLERCARLCLDPYPQPRKAPTTVPPCLGLPDEPTLGVHVGHINSTLLRDASGGLPAAFLLPQFAALLFGRPFANEVRHNRSHVSGGGHASTRKTTKAAGASSA